MHVESIGLGRLCLSFCLFLVDMNLPSPHRKLKMSDTVSAVVPVEGYPSKVVALIGRNICYVDRETGMHFPSMH